MNLVMNHTERKSFCATRLKNESKDGNQREETVRHDEVYNVIQVFAMQVYYKGRTCRVETTAVADHSILRVYTCINVTAGLRGFLAEMF